MKNELIPFCVVRLLLVHKLSVRDTDSPHLFPASLVSWYFPPQKPPCRNFLISLSYLRHRSSGVTIYLDSSGEQNGSRYWSIVTSRCHADFAMPRV